MRLSNNALLHMIFTIFISNALCYVFSSMGPYTHKSTWQSIRLKMLKRVNMLCLNKIQLLDSYLASKYSLFKPSLIIFFIMTLFFLIILYIYLGLDKLDFFPLD